ADRQRAAGGGGAADHRPYAPRHLLAAAGQGADDPDHLALQRLALRGRLARPIAALSSIKSVGTEIGCCHATRTAASGAQRKHVTLPMDFPSRYENGRSRPGRRGARNAPFQPFATPNSDRRWSRRRSLGAAQALIIDIT